MIARWRFDHSRARPHGSHQPPAAVFFYSPDRNGEHPQKHLKTFTGVLLADGYAGFTPVFGTGHVTEAVCSAQVRRKSFDEHATKPLSTTTKALDRIRALYGIEEPIRGKPPDERRRVHRDQAAVFPPVPAVAPLRQPNFLAGLRNILALASQYHDLPVLRDHAFRAQPLLQNLPPPLQAIFSRLASFRKCQSCHHLQSSLEVDPMIDLLWVRRSKPSFATPVVSFN